MAPAEKTLRCPPWHPPGYSRASVFGRAPVQAAASCLFSARRWQIRQSQDENCPGALRYLTVLCSARRSSPGANATEIHWAQAAALEQPVFSVLPLACPVRRCNSRGELSVSVHWNRLGMDRDAEAGSAPLQQHLIALWHYSSCSSSGRKGLRQVMCKSQR